MGRVLERMMMTTARRMAVVVLTNLSADGS